MSTEFTHKGHVFTVTHEHDSDHEPPWESGDGYGIVTDWIYMSRLDGDDQEMYRDRSLYRVLSDDGRAIRYYDVAASIGKAREEQWGLSHDALRALTAKIGHEPTPEEVAAEAVRKDYEYLRGWCNDAWSYVGVVVTLKGTNYTESLWGVESNSGDYLAEVARELAEAILADAPAQIDADMARLHELRASVTAKAAQ